MDFWSVVRGRYFLLLLLENVREVNEKILLGVGHISNQKSI